MPEAIRERLETLDLQTYAEAKEYAIKQARSLKRNLPNLDTRPSRERGRDGGQEEKKTRFQEESQEEEDSYFRDDILAWLGKGPGKGNKGSNPKLGKRKDGNGGGSRGRATTAASTGTKSTSAVRRMPT